MTFVDSIRAWHDFFLLTGGGAATMLGLVFVAVSLATGLPSLPSSREGELFVTPILWQYGYAFGTAATCLAPWAEQRHFGLFMTILGASAVLRSGWLLRDMLRHHRRSDGIRLRYWIWTGPLPTKTSAVTNGSSLCLWHTSQRPLSCVATATLALDLMGVRNTWQLVVWMIGERVPTGAAKPVTPTRARQSS